jgi:hypothetical protein
MKLIEVLPINGLQIVATTMKKDENNKQQTTNNKQQTTNKGCDLFGAIFLYAIYQVLPVA